MLLANNLTNSPFFVSKMNNKCCNYSWITGKIDPLKPFPISLAKHWYHISKSLHCLATKQKTINPNPKRQILTQPSPKCASWDASSASSTCACSSSSSSSSLHYLPTDPRRKRRRRRRMARTQLNKWGLNITQMENLERSGSHQEESNPLFWKG